MTIQAKKPAVPATPATDAAEAFIAGAPDATRAPYKGLAKGHKRQISLTITGELLRKVDEVAERTGQARAAVINLAIYHALEGDIFGGKS